MFNPHLYSDKKEAGIMASAVALKSRSVRSAYSLMDNRNRSVNTTFPKTTQAKFAYSFADNRPASVVQKKQVDEMFNYRLPKTTIQKKVNHTGLPDNLKSGIENLSGHSMDDVKVHYNSSKPAQLNAHAYAQGTNIHIASGQEKHLPHEAWHIVQQKQGRVKPTIQLKGKVNINDDRGLEKEADVMGLQASRIGNEWVQRAEKENVTAPELLLQNQNSVDVVQGNWKGLVSGALLGIGGALALSATFPVVAGAAVVGGVAGGIAGHFMGGRRQYRFGDNVQEAYTNWDEDQATNTNVRSRGGIDVRARHNRGAPYVTRAGVRDAYRDFIPATVGDEDDRVIAGDLLNNTDRGIRTDRQREHAAMMEAVVGLAEEWRKHGAAWVYRAILRGVQAGRWTMAQVPELFAFVRSANSGRRQVARIQDVRARRLSSSALVGEESEIADYGSDIDDSGFESDDEVRKRHRMKGKRLFSKKYDSDSDDD